MGYRRFIAYVYEYRKGKKENNCGFMKVEVRNHMCTIEPHLQVGNLAAGEVCKVYGFVRKEGLMNGILLGSCKTEANRIECLVETDGMDMGGSGIPLEKMGGMILLTESGGFFGTEWDDQIIRPENFKESIIKKEETGTVCEIIKEKAEEKLENESKPETDSTPDLDDRHEVEDVVEQMQDDLLEAEEMISDEPQAKDEPTVGEIWETEQKITCRVNTKPEEKEKTSAGKLPPRIWFIFQEDNAPFATTVFCNTDTTISDISFCAADQMAGTYLVYPEATTSRNSLWQACSAFPASKKATVSR